MKNNDKLKEAKRNKNDEFYTQLSDIENELKHYRNHFKGKVVFCNCDDPEWSEFFNYFWKNFSKLGLKKLITTHYSLNIEEDPSYQLRCVEYVLGDDGLPVPHKIALKGNGDFRSEECIELLKESDIVCTNPPFSLFREYVAQLIEYGKKFLIIGNFNAITYKEIFKLIESNQLWLGVSPRSMNFKLPTGEMKSVNAAWFTNLSHKNRNEKMTLWKTYESQEYQKFENYDAINIDKVNEIPVDFDGCMGVPITFLSKYNPQQFEIVALGITGSINFSSNKKMELLDANGMPTGKFTQNAKGTLYRKYDATTDSRPAFKDCETGELYSSIYARIIIKKRKEQNGN